MPRPDDANWIPRQLQHSGESFSTTHNLSPDTLHFAPAGTLSARPFSD
jgi:hypothetical protein